MKRTISFILVAVVIAVLFHLPCSAVGDAAAEYISFELDTVSKALIVSDDEIYLCGLLSNGSWLVKTNIDGEILERREFTDVIGKQPVIQCLSKTSDALMIGFVDSYTQKAAVGVIRNGCVEYTLLPGAQSVYLNGMNADDSGLSILGCTNDSSGKVLYYTRVLEDGATEQFVVGKSTKDDIVIGDSFAYATETGVYLLRMTKIEGVVNNCNRELVAFSHNGQPLWQVAIQEDIFVRGILATNETIYLYGFQRLEEKDCAVVMCFGIDGILRWTQDLDELEHIQQAKTTNGQIYIAGESDEISGEWMVYHFEKDGAMVQKSSVSLPEAYNSFWFFDNHCIDVILNIEGMPCLIRNAWSN